MTGDDQRLEEPRDGEHAEHALEYHEHEQHQRVCHADARLAARANRQRGDHDDDEAERAREVAMDHLDPGLSHIRVARVMLRASRRRDVAEAARPVRAAEAGIRQSRVTAEHDDTETQDRAEQGEATDPDEFAHAAWPQPMCDSLSSFLRSLSRSLVVWLAS